MSINDLIAQITMAQRAAQNRALRQAGADSVRARSILEGNRTKPFVRRIVFPEQFPSLDAGNGMRATHKMAWAEADGRYRVFPTIVYDGKGLREYPWRDALAIAESTGDYIDFDTPEEADWFSKNYKAVWGQSPR